MIACIECDSSQHFSCIEKFDKSFDKNSANHLIDSYVCNKCHINSHYDLDQQSVDNDSDEDLDEEDSDVDDRYLLINGLGFENIFL
jgi:hypothetical protein